MERDYPNDFCLATDKSHARHQEACDFVVRYLAAKPWRVAVATPAAGPGPEPAKERAMDVPESESVAPHQREEASAPQPRSAHAYGSSYAMCFNAVNGLDGIPGVMVDAASASDLKKVDWNGAIHLMLDVREVIAVYAVFHGLLPSGEFGSHGAHRDKAFFLERQKAGFFAKVTAAKLGVRAVRIQWKDASRIGMLFTQQLLRAYPDVPKDETLAIVRAIYGPDDGPD